MIARSTSAGAMLVLLLTRLDALMTCPQVRETRTCYTSRISTLALTGLMFIHVDISVGLSDVVISVLNDKKIVFHLSPTSIVTV